MSKKRNKSRLTKTDINRICEMQRTIDFYEYHMLAILHFSLPDVKSDLRIPELRGSDMDDTIAWIYRNIKKQKQELEYLRKESEANKIPKTDGTESSNTQQ